MKCGNIYIRIAWNNQGKKLIMWRCCTREKRGASYCSAPIVQEEELKHAVIDATDAVFENSQDMIDILEENILEVIRQDNSVEIEEINNTIVEKQKKLLDLTYGKKDYSKCSDERGDLRQHKHLFLVKHAQRRHLTTNQ